MSRCVKLVEAIVRAGRDALATEHGALRVAAALRSRPSRARRMIAVGKAAWAMADGALAVMPFDAGIVVCKEAPPIALPFDVVLAGHPRPDERSVRATREVLAFAEATHDELLVLLSGGTSSLLGGPVDGVSLDEQRDVYDRLLRSGAPIEDMNLVRRRLGAALGGRLRSPATIRALTISDVLSDDPRVIGSGPLHGDVDDTTARALAIADRIGVSPRVRAIIEAQQPSFTEVDAEIIAGPRSLLDAFVLPGFVMRRRAALIDGTVQSLIDEMASLQLEAGQCWVGVGEPTIALHGRGLGGRAQHVALAMASRLREDHVCLALASDGTDGPTPNAGAIVSSDTARGIDLRQALLDEDSTRALDALGCSIATGPTGTNLTDLYVLARAR